ncbi:MAG: Rho termination factor N-terminal domain-containing protein [Nostoc sp.]|uniref:Rho termination factor N-terminal domain-containing protein n=1 Tax=Nostoc sp. TaxID=1180 RepID=UPI002FF1F646
MQSLLTASIVFIPAAYFLLVTVEFILGISSLWNRSQPVTVAAVEPEATTPMIHPVIEPHVKALVVTLPTAEPELLATFAPELVLAAPTPMEAMSAAGVAIAPVTVVSTSAISVMTIRELKRMASSIGVKNYSNMRKDQLVKEILAKELVVV